MHVSTWMNSLAARICCPLLGQGGLQKSPAIAAWQTHLEGRVMEQSTALAEGREPRRNGLLAAALTASWASRWTLSSAKGAGQQKQHQQLKQEQWSAVGSQCSAEDTAIKGRRQQPAAAAAAAGGPDPMPHQFPGTCPCPAPPCPAVAAGRPVAWSAPTGPRGPDGSRTSCPGSPGAVKRW